MISLRFSFSVIVLLSIALIPTVIHNYIGASWDDNKSVKIIPEKINGFVSYPTNRNKRWVLKNFDSIDWVERIYNDQQTEIKFFAARSFDHKHLYHHPELALSYGRILKNDGVVKISHNPDIYAHLLRGQENGFAAYVLLFNNKSVKTPILFQIKESIKLLLTPRKLMTLLYVSDLATPTKSDFKKSAAANILKAAVDDFMAQY